jgi:hypothetical protein
MITRIDRLLTEQRLRDYPLILLGMWVLTYTLVAALTPSFDFLPDFTARWTAGRFLLEGRSIDLYDAAAQAAYQQAELGRTKLSWFVSPPFVGVMFAPLAALPYGVSGVLWTVISAGALVWACILLRPFAPPVIARRWRMTLLIAVTSIPTLELLGSGQDTSLVLLAIAGGTRLLNRGQAGWAGVVLAVGLMKPQLIFLVPVLFIARRVSWAAVTFTATGVGLAVLSWLLVGTNGLLTWLSLPFSSLYSTEVTHSQAWKSVSISAFLGGLAPSQAAWWSAIALVGGLSTAAIGVIALRAQRHTPLLWAGWGVVLLTTVVASPHFMIYDLVGAMPAILALAARTWDATTRVLLAVTCVLLWLAAPLHLISVGLNWPLSLVGLPWPAITIACLWLRFVRRDLRARPCAPPAEV